MVGRPRKEFHEYIIQASDSHISETNYVTSPATSFLKYTVEAKDAVDLCIRKFEKKKNGDYTKASRDSLEYIVCAMLPAIMGHFETYQRFLFSGIFEHSIYLKDFNIEKFFRDLKNCGQLEIDPTKLAAYRRVAPSSIGIILADSLVGWHSPEKVNAYYRCFGLNANLYSNVDCSRLRVLWQLRHSIVHTGGTLTIADSQKVIDLETHGGKNIAFENYFVLEISRRMHRLVKESTDRVGCAFLAVADFRGDTRAQRRTEGLFKVESTVSAWL